MVTDDPLTARSADVRTHLVPTQNLIFNRKQSILVVVAVAVLSTVGNLEAQAPNPAGANAAKYNVAVVDISYIFKNHARFRTMMENMKKEMEGIEAELKADREKIAQNEQQRNTYNAGSAEYKKLDEEVARQMADFNLKMGRLRKDFLEREAKVYYQTYLEVVDAVKYYAKRQNIGLVLRFNGEPVDPAKREDVLREINKPVVLQDQIDITPDVLVLLNRDQPSGGQPAAQGATQALRPSQPASQLPPR
jgi:Skp family chaperone for outer membrane proteins